MPENHFRWRPAGEAAQPLSQAGIPDADAPSGGDGRLETTCGRGGMSG